MSLVIPTQTPPAEHAISARQAIEQRSRLGHQAVYVGHDTVLCRVLGKYMCYVDTRDRGLGPHLILNGFWESWITIAIERFVQPGMVCIDVGANLGYYTMVMADRAGPGGVVLAFEPNPRMRELAEASMLLNGFLGRTLVARAAASDRDGDTARLSFAEELPMNGTIVDDTAFENCIDVPTITLDKAGAKLARLDLIKIDAEGAEEQIWDGMQGLLDRHPDAAVILEFNAMRGAAERLLTKIESRFPRLRHIDFHGNAVDLSRHQVMTERGHEDFMLWLSNS